MAPTHYRARQGWIPGDGSHIVLTGDVHVARGRDPQGAAADIRSDTMRVELEKPATQRPRHAKP
jgi:lipopolysaccharide export system protein LptC